MIAYVCLLVATIMRHLLLSDTQVSVKYGVASNWNKFNICSQM